MRSERAEQGSTEKDPWRVRLGRGIAATRTGRQLSRKVLANHLGVSYHRLAHWERGGSQPPLAKLIALGRILEVSTEELLAAGNNCKE